MQQAGAQRVGAINTVEDKADFSLPDTFNLWKQWKHRLYNSRGLQESGLFHCLCAAPAHIWTHCLEETPTSDSTLKSACIRFKAPPTQ